MATIYVPDDLKERLQNRASQLGFNIVEGSAGARASEMPEFLDYLLSLVTPPTTSAEDNNIVTSIWDHCAWAVGEVVNVAGYELRGNTADIEINHDSQNGMAISLISRQYSPTLIEDIRLAKAVKKLMATLFDEDHQLYYLEPHLWWSDISPFKNPELIERAAMFTVVVGENINANRQTFRPSLNKFYSTEIDGRITTKFGEARPYNAQFAITMSLDSPSSYQFQEIIPMQIPDGSDFNQMVQYRRMLQFVENSPDPDDRQQALFDMGWLYRRLNRGSEALELFQKARQLKIEQLGFAETVKSSGCATLTPTGNNPWYYDDFAWWGKIQSRDYMRICQSIGLQMWDMGRFNYARNTFKHLLELNPRDNQGIRHLYLAVVAEQNGVKLASGKKVGKFDTLAKRLIKESRNRKGSIKEMDMLYGEALLHFIYGNERQANDVLREAFNENPHVPVIFFSARLRQKIEGEAPISDVYVSSSTREEAESYYRYAIGAWRNTPGALAWLLESAQKSRTLPKDCQPPKKAALLIDYENPNGYLVALGKYGGIREIYPDCDKWATILKYWNTRYPGISAMMVAMRDVFGVRNGIYEL